MRTRRGGAALRPLSAATALLAVLVMAPAAQAASARAPGLVAENVKLHGGTDMCLAVVDATAHDGAPVALRSCHDIATELQWDLVAVDSRYFAIRSRHNGKCLEVARAGMLTGAPIVQWICHREGHQQWSVDYTFGFMAMKVRHSGKCLEALSDIAGDNPIQAPCGERWGQAWVLG